MAHSRTAPTTPTWPRTLALAFAAVMATTIWPEGAQAQDSLTTRQQAFQVSMNRAMGVMDTEMQKVPGTGDPDSSFAAMMILHHQGAIDMAKAELQYGRDAVLRRMAQEIIVTQQQEIAVLRHQLVKMPPHAEPDERQP